MTKRSNTMERFTTEHQACNISLEDRWQRKLNFNIDASTDDLLIEHQVDGVIVWYEEGGQGFLKIDWDHLEGCRRHVHWCHHLAIAQFAGVEWDGSPVVLASDDELDRMADLFGAVWSQRDKEFLHVSAQIEFKPERKVADDGRLV